MSSCYALLESELVCVKNALIKNGKSTYYFYQAVLPLLKDKYIDSKKLKNI